MNEDRVGASFATLFARDYLTWSADDPEARRQALAPFVGEGLDPEAGLQPAAGSDRRVDWAEAVQSQPVATGERRYTVAVQTDSAGLLYLSVPVLQERGGELALAGYPALVGPPAIAGARPPAGRREVEDRVLRAVVERALRNYLARAENQLDADLAAGERIRAPTEALMLEAVESLGWVSDDAIEVLLLARDAAGSRFHLAYDLGVLESAGRWEITSIQTNRQ